MTTISATQQELETQARKAIEKNNDGLMVVPVNDLDHPTAAELVREDFKANQVKGEFETPAATTNPELVRTYGPPTQAGAITWADVNATNEPAQSSVAHPTLEIDPATLERLAVNRARDSAAVREALNLNSLEPNLEKEQQKLAGDGEANRSAWLKKAEEAKASQALVLTPKTDNKLNSDDSFSAGEDVKVKPVIPPEIASQYIRTGDKFYHPKTPDLVAFEDKGNKLETKSDSENISLSLVKIAQARGWNEIKISGSEKFRQEAWLEASALGMTVKGYTPNDADKAQVAKRISEIKPNQVEKVATVFEGEKTTAAPEKAQVAIPDSKHKLMAATFAKESSAEALKKYPELAGAVAVAAAIDKQAQVAGLTPEQRAIGAAYVHQKLTNSIERGEIPPPVTIRVPVEVKREASEDREYER